MAQEQAIPQETGAAEAETAAESAAVPEKPGILRRILSILKKLTLLFLFVCLIGGGFFFGVRLRIIDMNELNRELELYKYPIIGEYFEEPEPLAEEPAEESAPESAKPAAKQPVQEQPSKAAAASKTVVVDKEAIEKQLKLRQAEEKKRVAKLARLYEQMKADRAAEILQALDDSVVIAILQRMDETQVTKILSAFETARSAQITQKIYNGPPPVQQVP